MFEQDFPTNKVQPVPEDYTIKIEKVNEYEVSEEEQEEARNYVLHKELNRPTTGLFSFLKCLFIFITSTIGATFLTYILLKHKLHDVLVFLENELEQNPTRLCIWILVIYGIIGLIFSTKRILIGFIHLYQKFSPEEVRRRCLFKPTCSEYAIIALNKYGVFKALPKIFDRCSRCHGDTYRIDYP